VRFEGVFDPAAFDQELVLVGVGLDVLEFFEIRHGEFGIDVVAHRVRHNEEAFVLVRQGGNTVSPIC